MGAKISKHYSLKSLLNPFKLFLNFLLSGPYKSTVLNFWNFGFLIFQKFLFVVFVNVVPYESQNVKKLLLPQITFEFLALLDYVSRPHEIEFVRRPSSVSQYLRTYCADSFQISAVASPRMPGGQTGDAGITYWVVGFGYAPLDQ